MAFDIGPVVTDGGGGTMYAVGADIGDYIRCGNPYAACAVPAARGSVRETICDPFGYRCRRLNWGMDGRFPARPALPQRDLESGFVTWKVRLAGNCNSPRMTGTLQIQVCYLARPAGSSRPVTQRMKNAPEIHTLVSSRS